MASKQQIGEPFPCPRAILDVSIIPPSSLNRTVTISRLTREVRPWAGRASKRVLRLLSPLALFAFLALATFGLPFEGSANEPGTSYALNETSYRGSSSQAVLPQLETFIDKEVTRLRREHEVPGVIIAIVYRGKIALVKGYGFADATGMRKVDGEKTLFRAASISKTVTWTAVMQLVERGELDLDRSVNDYLNGFKIDERYGPVTMRHLMTHSAGFEDGFVGYLNNNREEDLVGLEQALGSHIPEQVRPPGVYASYSNYGAALAGLIVANISGESFDQYVETKIFAPLGMRRSTFREPVPATFSNYQPVGLVSNGKTYREFGFEYLQDFAPSASLSTTASDMARFMLAHLGDGAISNSQSERRILSRDTVHLMRSPLLSAHPGLPSTLHGFYEERINGRMTYGHEGTINSFRSKMTLMQKPDMGIFVSANSAGGSRLRRELVGAFFDKYFPRISRTEEVPSQPSDPAVGTDNPHYAGYYRDLRRSYSKWEKISVLFGTSDLTVVENSDGSLSIPSSLAGPIEGHKLVPIGDGLFASETDPDLRIAFQRGDNNETSHLFLDSLAPFERIGFAERGVTSLTLLGSILVIFLGFLGRAMWRWREWSTMKMPERIIQGSIILAILLNLSFVGSLIGLIALNFEELQSRGLPDAAIILFNLPLVAVGLSAVGSAVLAFGWGRIGWSQRRKIRGFGFFLSAMIFATSLNHWNLLGSWNL